MAENESSIVFTNNPNDVNFDREDSMHQAICLKEFIIKFMENKQNNENLNEISLQDLNSLVASSPHCYFLRQYFRIDSRSLLKRTHMFLLSLPDRFVVDYNAGMVRFTKPDETTQEHLCRSIINRSCDFLTLCLSLQPAFLIPVKQLYDYLRYAALDVETHLTDYQFFQKFLDQRHDLFYTDQDYVCQANVQQKMEKRNFDLNRIEERQIAIEDRLLNKTKFVYNIETGKRVKERIEANVNVIAFDSEGTHLGESNGILTLVQVAFIEHKVANLTQEEVCDQIKVFIFDILRCEELITECIAPLLANDKIIKIMHDSKNDFAALKLYFRVEEIKTVFDTSTCYFRLTRSPTNGLHTIYEEITGLARQNLKPHMRRLYQNNYRIWENRPLSSFLQFYAAFDVLCLMTIYLWIDSKYNLKPEMYTKNLKNDDAKVVYSIGCVQHDDESEVMIDENVLRKKKTKKIKPGLPYISYKKTADELEELRKKVEYLEKVARGEIEQSYVDSDSSLK